MDILAVWQWIKDEIKHDLNERRGFVSCVVTNFSLFVFAYIFACFFTNSGFIRFIFALAPLLAFLGGGLRQVKTAHKGMITIFGRRILGVSLNEGLNWTLPSPLVEIEDFDTREKEFDIRVEKYKSKDGIPIDIDIAVHWQIITPSKAFAIENREKEIENAVKEAAAKFLGSHKAFGPDGEYLLNEQENIAKDMESGLTLQASDWGMKLNVVITNIRAPRSIERSAEQIVVEKLQTRSETIEAAHVAQMIKTIMATGVDAKTAANIVQTERKKARRIIVDTESDRLGIVRAGAIATDAKKGGNA